MSGYTFLEQKNWFDQREYEGCLTSATERAEHLNHFPNKVKIITQTNCILHDTSSTWLHKPVSCTVPNVCLVCMTEKKWNSGTPSNVNVVERII